MAEIDLTPQTDDVAASKHRSIATAEDVDWLAEWMRTNYTSLTVWAAEAPLDIQATFASVMLRSDQLPLVKELLSTGRIKAHAVLDGSHALYISAPDIVFGRSALPQKLKQAEKNAASYKRQVDTYVMGLQHSQEEIEDIRRKMQETQTGIHVDELTALVNEWPEIVDFRVGPCFDPMSRQFIPPATMVISFLPILFDGHDVPTHGKDRFAISSIVRLALPEDGKLRTMPGTIHPHMTENNLCQGNLPRILTVFMRENNVLGALDLLRQFVVGHYNGDWLDANYAMRSWTWLESHLIRGVDRHMLGNWDGVSAQLSAPGAPIVRLDEFFEGSVEDILHVGTGKRYIDKAAVAELTAAKAKMAAGAAFCDHCGGEITVCPCHPSICSRSMIQSYACDAGPVDGWVPYPNTNLPRNEAGEEWGHFTRAELRQRGSDYTCQYSAGARVCGKPAPWIDRRGIHFPGIVCDAHLPTTVKKAWQARIDARSKIANDYGVGNLNKNLRHSHSHQHAQYYAPHTHHHEHALEAALDDTITAHDRNHIAYRGATGGSYLRHRQELGR